MSYSNPEYFNMLMCLGKTDCNYAAARRTYEARFGHKPGVTVPSESAFQRLHNRVYATGSVHGQVSVDAGRPRERNVKEEQVLDMIAANPTRSTRSVARQLETNHMRVWRMLKEEGENINMDVLGQHQKCVWCKPDWELPSMSKETNELLMQCANIPNVELSDDIDEIIEKSKAFPIPFPIETVRLEQLKERRPIERLKKNIVSTYPLMHERVLLLMTHFLVFKREHGSAMEKALYKDMTVPDFIDRILTKRAVTFMGRHDSYKLLTGEKSVNGWETIGTVHQRPPLLLENCLSYDELKISAMVYVSGYTECINDGTRHNNGIVKEKNIEPHAVIIGIIGPRFQRKGRMDYEDILVTEQQNVPTNGYGEVETTEEKNNQSSKHMWRQMWSMFYEVNSYIYDDLKSNLQTDEKNAVKRYTDRYVKRPSYEDIFDNEVYYKRISIIIETVLLEAEKRAVDEGKFAFLNVIGPGLGLWKVSPHQLDVFILTCVERIQSFLKRDLLNHVSDINFAYIKPSATIMVQFTNKTKKSKEKKIFLKYESHPKGGINVQLENREPSSKLLGEHKGKLLVMTYAWDSNAHPGNEFWLGKLHSSGDPAAACSSQVSELHNAHVNGAVCARTARVAAARGLQPLPAYCRDNNRTQSPESSSKRRISAESSSSTKLKSKKKR